MQQPSPPTADKHDKKPMLTPDEFRALVAHVQRHYRRSYRLEWILFVARLIVLSSGLTGLYKIVGLNIVFILTLVVAIMMFISFRTGHHLRNNKRQAKRLTRFVENTQDVTLLGIILDLHHTSNRLGEKWNGTYAATDAAVLRLLPSLQAGNADVLNTQQREHLRRFLLRRRTRSSNSQWPVPQYCLPVLSALETIGDKRDLPDVEQLARAGSLNEEVCTAAKRCAQVIRERLQRESVSSVLLRPDRKPETVETLLRPSTENVSVPPQQLLRAATSEESSPSA